MMTLDNRTRRRLLDHCGNLDEGDGVDPRLEYPSSGRRQNRKAKQLSRQVAETLELVLTGESGDPLLRDLIVLSVDPAPDSSRMLVTLQADMEHFNRQAILEALTRQTGWLRSEVARSITRKRVPALAFHVVGPPMCELDTSGPSACGY